MKHFTSSLIALAIAGTAVQAQAQDAAQAEPPRGAAQPAQPDTTTPPATPAPPTDAAPPQQTPAPDTATPPAAAPSASAATSAATQVSDAEVDHFAKATVAVQKINADTKLDEKTKQTQMAAAVTSAGIDPARYNEIGQAVASDTALRAKVQTAMAKYAGPSKG